MRLLWSALLAVGLAGQTAVGQPANGGAQCSEALQSLNNQWGAIAYPDPSKPAQSHVVGKDGHENTGGEVLFMKSQIRLANVDCNEGRIDDALAHVDNVRRLLNH